MLTLDDFYRRIIEPKAAAGDQAAIAMLKAREEAKAGTLTPAGCRELASEAEWPERKPPGQKPSPALHPAYRCQKCGALIGYVGRFFQWTRVFNLHWLLDGCDGKP